VHIYYNELWLVKNKTTTYCEQIDFLSDLPRSAARRVPLSGGAAQSPVAGGRQRGV
jgi:hypothetical protein